MQINEEKIKENQVSNFEKKSWSKSHKERDGNRGKNEKLSDIMIWMETRNRDMKTTF